MGCEPDLWAKEWLAEQRKNGSTGLTVEKKGSVHYLKWATTEWDPGSKKRRKVSEYRGVLSPDGTVTPPTPRMPRVTVVDVLDEGRPKLMAKAAEGLIGPLKTAFPDIYGELLALAFCRCVGRGPINKFARTWSSFDDVLGLRPKRNPGTLAKVLELAGGSEHRRNMFFNGLPKHGSVMAVDMSVCFSRSEGAFIVKKGYNRFRMTATQFNLALICDTERGMPEAMRTVAGNIREGSVKGMLEEFDIKEGTVLVMDRGYFSKDIMDAVTDNDNEFVIAARRNCTAYDTVSTEWTGMFRWSDRAVMASKGTWNGFRAYRFEDQSLKNDELWDAMKARDEKGIEPKCPAKAGHLILISSLDTDPEDIYRMYKYRDMIEKCFDTAKNVLDADRTYMHDDLRIMGHNLVTFISLYITMRIYGWLEDAGLLTRHSVSDVLDIYGSVRSIRTDMGDLPYDIGADVRRLDRALGVDLYPIPRSEG
jgi:hypothetical protein